MTATVAATLVPVHAGYAQLPAATITISPPSIEYRQLLPMLVVFGVAVAGVLVEAFVPRPRRRPVQLALALAGLAVAFALLIVVAATSSLFSHSGPGHLVAMGSVGVDGPTLFIQGTILVLAGASHTEVYPLTMFAVGGMLLFPAANDLLTMFVALEVLSLPLYLLCGL